MTSARRVCTVVELDPAGQALGYERGGMRLDYAETVGRYFAADGADEVWLHLNEPDDRGAAGLFARLKELTDSLFVPVVAWGGIRSIADGRLAVGMGADRVVIDCQDPALDDPVAAVRDLAAQVGSDRVSVAVAVRRVAKTHSFAWERVPRPGEEPGQDALTFLVELCQAGAGELVVLPRYQGELAAHATDLVERLSMTLEVQVVSVGAEREMADLAAPLLMGADAVASASMFRSGQVGVGEVKAMLRDLGVAVRPAAPPYVRAR